MIQKSNPRKINPNFKSLSKLYLSVFLVHLSFVRCCISSSLTRPFFRLFFLRSSIVPSLPPSLLRWSISPSLLRCSISPSLTPLLFRLSLTHSSVVPSLPPSLLHCLVSPSLAPPLFRLSLPHSSVVPSLPPSLLGYSVSPSLPAPCRAAGDARQQVEDERRSDEHAAGEVERQRVRPGGIQQHTCQIHGAAGVALDTWVILRMTRGR